MLRMNRLARLPVLIALVAVGWFPAASVSPAAPAARAAVFNLEEATIADIQAAFTAGALKIDLRISAATTRTS